MKSKLLLILLSIPYITYTVTDCQLRNRRTKSLDDGRKIENKFPPRSEVVSQREKNAFQERDLEANHEPEGYLGCLLDWGVPCIWVGAYGLLQLAQSQ